MGITIRFLFAAGAFALATGAHAQTPASDSGKLTARELFYAARDTAKPGNGSSAPNRNTSTPPAIQTPPGRAKVPNPPQQSYRPDASAAIIPVSDAGAAGPLGLRYTVLQQSGDQNLETAPDMIFHSGDHIRLRVEANDDGYLYIVHQGTSGTWSVLFPSPEIENGDNRVHRGRTYTVPSQAVFSFTGEPGTEKLFAVLSRQPETELESLMYSLRQHTNTPAQAPTPNPPVRVLMASNATNIGDEMISRMRNDLQARDLIIEKAGEDPAAKEDKSVYVVNPTGSAASRVVADIALTHR